MSGLLGLNVRVVRFVMVAEWWGLYVRVVGAVRVVQVRVVRAVRVVRVAKLVVKGAVNIGLIEVFLLVSQ
jgi:hypothetical protein